MKPNRPPLPRAVDWILGCLLPEAYKEAVLGDLAEERSLGWREGSVPNETLWYWRQVARSLPSLLWAAVQRGRWVGFIGAGLAAYAVVTLIESAGTVVLTRVFVPSGLAGVILGLALGLGAMVVGGYVAGLLRRGAAAVLAVISAISVIALMIRSVGNVSIWYSVLWLIACPVMAMAGGSLVRTRAAHRRET